MKKNRWIRPVISIFKKSGKRTKQRVKVHDYNNSLNYLSKSIIVNSKGVIVRKPFYYNVSINIKPSRRRNTLLLNSKGVIIKQQYHYKSPLKKIIVQIIKKTRHKLERI